MSGVINRLELFLERPLQWIVCLLHQNELPFCHLFDAIDGKTTSYRLNTTFAGEIALQIKEKVHQLRPVAFQTIPSDILQMSPEVIKDVSTDQ